MWRWVPLLCLTGCFAGEPDWPGDCGDSHDDPCPAGQACVERYCYDVCLDSMDCEPAEACVEGTCQSYAQQCQQHTECIDSHWYCKDGACAKFPGGESSCFDDIFAGDETDLDCGGPCAPCYVDQACLENADCRTDACEDNVCVPTCTDGFRNADESDVDCGGSCLLCAVGRRCEFGTDCIDGVCVTGFCRGATCDDDVHNGNETGLDCGGPCNPCPDNELCNEPPDCISGVCDGTCQVPACDDSVLNGNESDLDCGGDCSPCDVDQHCSQAADCISQVCAGDVCRAATCVDTTHNGDETDVDCGGSCALCPDDKMCLVADDCQSGVCDSTCQAPACDDFVANGDETDVDCGGSCLPCADGLACGGHSDCESGRCEDFICVPCPLDMIYIPATTPYCIDRYEATFIDDPSCVGSAVGQDSGSEYSAAGFPRNVTSAGYGAEFFGVTLVEPTAELYACGLEGSRPSRFVSLFQAKRGCENVGKELCHRRDHWVGACGGESWLPFPYGTEYDSSACNGSEVSPDTTVASGQFARCEGAYPGVFDMLGNVAEWTIDCDLTSCDVVGGGYDDTDDATRCTTYTKKQPMFDWPSYGFRCCWTPD